MRTLLIPIATLIMAPLSAQPGELFFQLDPCGVFPYQQVDLTEDGLPDLIITGRSEGTDDVPSSSGHCSVQVQCAPGTSLLSSNPMGGEVIPAQYGLQGTLRTDPPEEDHHLPAQHWTTAEILVRRWAYGTDSEKVVQPDLSNTVFLARTIANGSDILVAFRVMNDDRTQEIGIEVLGQAPYGSVLSW